MAFRASGAVKLNAGSGNMASVGLPTGIKPGDILILMVAACDNVVCSVDQSYTNKVATNGGTFARLEIWWKRAGTSEVAPTVTHAAGNDAFARLHAFTGAIEYGDPFSDFNSQGNAGTLTITSAGITPGGSEDVIFAAMAGNNAGTSGSAQGIASYATTDPTSWTERTDDKNETGTNDVNGSLATGVSSKGLATDNGTATEGWSYTAAQTNTVGALLSLRKSVATMPPFKIAHPLVGPMALRHTFRPSQIPQFLSPAGAPPITIAWDAASSSGYQASLSTYNWSHTCTGTNRGLIVNVSIFATGTVSSVTYNGVNMRFIRFDAQGVYRNEMWALEAPATGANSVVVTLSASLTSIASADSYTGVNQTDMIEGHTGATGVGGTPSVSIATVDDNSWVVDDVSTSDTTMSATAPQTERANNTGALGSGAIADYGPITPTQTVTESWAAVGSLDSWALGIVVLAPYSATVYEQIMTATLSFVGTFGPTKTFKVLSGTLSFIGNIPARTISHVLASTLSFVGNFNKFTTKTAFTGTVSFVGTTLKQTLKPLTGNLSFSGNIVRTPVKVLTAALSFSGSLVKSTARSLTGTLSFSGTNTKRTSRSLTGSLSFSGAMTKLTSRIHSASLSFSGALNRTTNKVLSGTVSFVGTIGRTTFKALTASLSFAGNLATNFIHAGGTLYTMTLTASLSFSGSMTKMTKRGFTATLGMIGSSVGPPIILVSGKVAKKIKGIFYEEL